ncbi:HTH_48 domain-containing protein [Trichonephila clavipes]|nr:HTH_48 domain-containing protein [Trichonephila clavipes]
MKSNNSQKTGIVDKSSKKFLSFLTTSTLYTGCGSPVVKVSDHVGHVMNLSSILPKTRHIKDELDSVYGDSTPSFAAVKFWVAEFKRDRKSLGDVQRSDRPNTATTDENIAKVHQMELDDH